MKIYLLLFFLLISFDSAFAQRKPRFDISPTAYENVDMLIKACLRKEYANCYHLAEIYHGTGKRNSILKNHADDKIFDLIEMTPEKKEKAMKSLRQQQLSKDKKVVLRERMTATGMDFIGRRLFFEACKNGEEMSCIKISERCNVDDDEKFCKLRKEVCEESTRGCQIIAEHEDRTQSEKIFWGAILAMGLASFIISRSIFQDEEEFQAGEKLDEDNTKKSNSIAKHGVILKYSRPFFKRYVSPIVGGMKSKKQIKEKYKRPLASAGLTQVLTPEDFFSFKLFLIIGFPVLFVGIRQFLEETWPLQYIPLIAIFGFFYPDFWIRGTVAKRQEAIISGMPFCVDMLALSVEAGLDFVAAMTKVIEKAPPTALSEEFEIMIKEIKVGASRAEALRNLAWRTDLIQVSSFTATLIAADSVGASVGPILKALGNEIRQKRSSDIEKKGATAATKILIPMIFFIVPAVLLVIMGPVAVDYLANQ